MFLNFFLKTVGLIRHCELLMYYYITSMNLRDNKVKFIISRITQTWMSLTISFIITQTKFVSDIEVTLFTENAEITKLIHKRNSTGNIVQNLLLQSKLKILTSPV